MEGKATGTIGDGRDGLERCFGAFISAADTVSPSTFSFGPGTDVEVSWGLFTTGDVGAVTLPLGEPRMVVKSGSDTRRGYASLW